MTPAQLKAKGFDKSWRHRGLVHVQCSQCEAMVIQGVPVHERGCPNEKKRRRQGLGEFSAHAED